jgi:Leucine-rich repeat (LRR) protein
MYLFYCKRQAEDIYIQMQACTCRCLYCKGGCKVTFLVKLGAITVHCIHLHCAGRKHAFVLKVLQELPEGLAVSVLAASAADLQWHLSILPASLHPLAIEAAFPSIRRHHSLTLDISSFFGSNTPYTVLRAATTGTIALKKLHLQYISVCANDDLLQLISAACRSALDVNLEFTNSYLHQVPDSQPYLQLEDTLSHNTALTSLQLSFPDIPCQFFRFELLLESLKSLQTLKLAPRGDFFRKVYHDYHLPPARHFISLPVLTHLCLGHGFHFMELSQIVPYMTRLKALSLRGFDLEELPPLCSLTALQTLELVHCERLKQLPPLDTLTALQQLKTNALVRLQRVPPLATLTALQTLELANCAQFQEVPPLDTLTALHTLVLSGFALQQIPPLATLTALQLLSLHSCLKVQVLPPLDNLTALHTLVLNSELLQQAPPLATLTALQTLDLGGCRLLHELPPLATLTGLHTLDLSGCFELKKLPSLENLTALRTLDLSECYQLQQLPPLDTLASLTRLDLEDCEGLRQLPPLGTLTALQTLDLKGCLRLRQLPPLPPLQTLQVFGCDNIL